MPYLMQCPKCNKHVTSVKVTPQADGKITMPCPRCNEAMKSRGNVSPAQAKSFR